MSARLLKRIVCFHSNVDFGVTTHLAGVAVAGPLSTALNEVRHQPTVCRLRTDRHPKPLLTRGARPLAAVAALPRVRTLASVRWVTLADAVARARELPGARGDRGLGVATVAPGSMVGE